jgi:type I restriction enzyme M protein
MRSAPLLDAYDVYQHLMDYWTSTMQDDCYLIAADGWKAGAQPREIRQVKNKDGKLAWPESHDYKKGKRRFKSDLILAAVLIARYFTAERDAIAALEAELATLEQQLDEMQEEQGGELACGSSKDIQVKFTQWCGVPINGTPYRDPRTLQSDCGMWRRGAACAS